MEQLGTPQEKELDIGRVIRLLLMQSKLIILIVFLGFALGVINFFTADRFYKNSSLLQVYSNQSNQLGSDLNLDLFLGNSNTSDIENIENLYKSRSNILQIIKEMNLNISIEENRDSIIENIKTFKVDGLIKNEKKDFIINFNDLGFAILDNNENFIADGSYDQLTKLDNLTFKIQKPELMDPVRISVKRPMDVFKQISSRFTVSPLVNRVYGYRSTGLLEIDYVSNHPLEGNRVLDYANNLFINNNIKTESETARKAIEFIDIQIDEIERKLELDKENLQNFKQSNRTIDVNIETQAILENIERLETALNELEIEITEAEISYTRTNPIYLDLLNRKATLQKQKSLVEAEITSLPAAQQEYIDLFRTLELSQEVFSELQNRKLGFSITQASTLGNIRVIDSSYTNQTVSPRLTDVIFITFISIIIAILYAIFRGLYIIPISNPAELADNNIRTPLFAVIPYLSDIIDKKESLQDDEENTRFAQAIESSVVNIKTALNESKTNEAYKIILTSPTAHNGKSLTSRNLSKKLASLNHKVLLFDADFKRGDQHKNFDVKKISLKDFLSINEHNIEAFKTSENLYLIPKISGLSSSFQALYSKEFSEKLDFLSETFDYIVFDTAPLLSVSDTSILLSYADVSIAVVRHGATKINEIKQMYSIASQIGIDFDGVIYNGYQKPSSYYGYYGLYGNYDYQYYAKKYLYENYEYKDEK